MGPARVATQCWSSRIAPCQAVMLLSLDWLLASEGSAEGSPSTLTVGAAVESLWLLTVLSVDGPGTGVGEPAFACKWVSPVSAEGKEIRCRACGVHRHTTAGCQALPQCAPFKHLALQTYRH